MKRVDVLNQVVESGVVAVVRGTREQAYKTAKACIAGDVKAIELTFTVPEADKVIAQLNEEYGADDEVIIGAGTVMDAITARIAMIAGAKFIVSPTFDKETALLCNKYQVPYMPGCMSVTEIQTAMEYGSDIVKVFPGSVVGNGFVSAVKAPIPYANIMPTGGVNLENMKDWYAKGVVVVGAGSNLVGPADQGDYAAVTANAKKYRAEIQQIKGTK
ncbi:bifunctional 2-keto-4-hydroxyglutarate aldolase/2-keto-3-deoxy-6-phosphogluconate aldolase [Ligilactobacillus hohenheimensis]|uniref:bifunctional 2-keto-4-hydroxyglutarate aldolase/2-keto-3-deoxy-6-phosphogluconate aldolase n=1 Tax=Ligilactobacillus hohenheimensis TaxID=2991832 RepID=UPI0024B9D4EE|nr:bifunctional 2-keto-4-hydroxyglutarate aldolase/2-keto-3-deoxy-6-phosphogluconate aldolase [Ligilactobacillus hohenheimensis]